MRVTVYRIQGDVICHSMVACGMRFPQKLSLMRPFLEFRPILQEWKRLSCTKVRENPLGAFAEFDLVGGVPVVFPQALAIPEVVDFLTSAGELLPLSVESGDAYALNVTRTVDACDRSRSRMHETASGQPATDWPVFRRTVVHGMTGLFRIGECRIALYLAEPADGAGFYAAYKRHGLTGLMFEEQPISES